MPYELYEEDGKHCVRRSDTKEKKGCSDSEEKAKKHLAALYAAEGGKYSVENHEFCGEEVHFNLQLLDQVKDHLKLAAKLQMGHLSGHVPVDEDSQEELMDHINAALGALKAIYAEKARIPYPDKPMEEDHHGDDEDEYMMRKRRYYDSDSEDLDLINQILASGEVEEYAWEGPIVFEGVKTGDNRIFKPGAIQWDESTLPWAFRWQRSSIKGHEGAVPIGRVDKLERREDGAIVGYGVIIPSLNEEAAEYLRLIKAGVASGVSVDGDSAEFDVQELDGGGQQMVFTNMRLRSLTAVDIPAFNAARVGLTADGELDEFSPELDEWFESEFATAGWEIVNWGGAKPFCVKPKVTDTPGSGEALKVALTCFATEQEANDFIESTSKTAAEEAKKVGQPVPTSELNKSAEASIDGMDIDSENSDIELGVKPNPGTDPDMRLKENADEDFAKKKKRKKRKMVIGNRAHSWTYDTVTAAAIPVMPKTEWFIEPELDGPTPITVTPDGAVYGHLALFDSCHIGFPGACVKPPKGSQYRYFHTGEVETSEGELVEVGHLTFNTGHAGMKDSPAAAAAHYDNTGTVAADVRCGEDKYGIWVAGALRPSLTDEDIRAFRAAPLSGDWRRISGKMELVGALAVNVPGFPVPRARALVASGEVETLITFEEIEMEQFSDYETRLRTIKRIEFASMAAKNEEEFHTFLDSVDDINAIEEFFNRCHDQGGRFCGGGASGGGGGNKGRIPKPVGYVKQRIKTAKSTAEARQKSANVERHTTGALRRIFATSSAYGSVKTIRLKKANLKDFSDNDLKVLSKQVKSDERRWNNMENFGVASALYNLASASTVSAATGVPVAGLVASAVTSAGIGLGYGRWKRKQNRSLVTKLDGELSSRGVKASGDSIDLESLVEEFASDDAELTLAQEIAKATKEIQATADKVVGGDSKPGKAPVVPEDLKKFINALEVDKEEGLTPEVVKSLKELVK